MNVVIVLFALLFFGSIIFFNVIKEKNSDIKTQQTRVTQLEEKCKEHVKANTDLSNKASALQGKNIELENQLNICSSNLASVERNYKLLNDKYSSLQQQIGQYKKQIEQYKKSVSQLEIDKRGLSTQLRNASSDIYRKNNDYRVLQDKYNSLKYKYDDLVNKRNQNKEIKRGKHR